jgi:ADP-heptose:LPS heptosyltransferase
VSGPKILAVQFKYYGDAVLMMPSLRALREHFAQGELHVLVPEKIAPVLQQLPWLDRVWPMPHHRGSVTLGKIWPVIRALRPERFEPLGGFCQQ